MNNYLIHKKHFLSKHYDEFSELYSVANVEEKLLEKGSFRGEVRITKSAHVMLNCFKINKKVLQLGTGIQGHITFAIWEPTSTFSWKNHAMSKGMIGILWKNEHQCVIGSGFTGIPISVDEEFFKKICRLKGYPDLMDLLKNREVLNVDEAKLKEIRYMIKWINVNTQLTDTVLYDLLENQLVSKLIECLSSHSVENVSQDLTIGKFTELVKYIHDDISNITSLTQVCKNTNISERTVRRLIKKKYDISPKKYLNALRLNHVRKELKRNSENSSVLKIASEFNFWHMGQFSRDYKNLFGELPSQTLLK